MQHVHNDITFHRNSQAGLSKSTVTIIKVKGISKCDMYCTLPDISRALWSLEVCPAMALIWMKFAPVRKGTQARISNVSCQLKMKATITAMARAQIVLVASPNLDPAA